jgi:hypothetical protein
MITINKDAEGRVNNMDRLKETKKRTNKAMVTVFIWQSFPQQPLINQTSLLVTYASKRYNRNAEFHPDLNPMGFKVPCIKAQKSDFTFVAKLIFKLTQNELTYGLQQNLFVNELEFNILK